MRDLSWKTAANPPSDDRTVVIQLKYGGTELGYFRSNQWFSVTGRTVAVINWSERPNTKPSSN